MKRVLLALLAASSPAIAQPGAEPAVETPPVEAPAVETPPVEAPAVETPAVETPAVETPAVETPAEPSTASDDIDLGALGLDPTTAPFDDKLQIYGFADFSYSLHRFGTPLVPDDQRFSVGNVNLFVRKNLSPRWRSLAEVRLMFAPNGAIATDFSGNHISTAVTDHSNFERNVSWGGIRIERVYVEYDLTPWLTARAGHFLTPYGIWNIDHGSPTIIGASRPYMIGEQLFPEHQTGIELFGAKSFDEYRLEYHATVSNGRNPFEATRDPDGLPAFGGRLALSTPWLGAMKLGASAYRGRAFEGTGPTNAVTYDEVALGADAQLDLGGFHVQGELLFQQRRYRDGRRAARGAGFAPDGIARGFYVLAGYRFSTLWNVMPFVMYEDYTPFDPTMIGAHTHVPSFGLNFRPIPSVVLKATAAIVKFPAPSFLQGNATLASVQAAWVF